MPTPLEDDGTRTRTPVPTESTATRPHPLPDDPASHPAPTRSPLDYLRKRFRQRPSSGSSGIPDIVVESPVSTPTLISTHLPHSRDFPSAHIRWHAVRTRDDHVTCHDCGASRPVEP